MSNLTNHVSWTDRVTAIVTILSLIASLSLGILSWRQAEEIRNLNSKVRFFEAKPNIIFSRFYFAPSDLIQIIKENKWSSLVGKVENVRLHFDNIVGRKLKPSFTSGSLAKIKTSEIEFLMIANISDNIAKELSLVFGQRKKRYGDLEPGAAILYPIRYLESDTFNVIQSQAPTLVVYNIESVEEIRTIKTPVPEPGERTWIPFLGLNSNIGRALVEEDDNPLLEP